MFHFLAEEKGGESENFSLSGSQRGHLEPKGGKWFPEEKDAFTGKIRSHYISIMFWEREGLSQRGKSDRKDQGKGIHHGFLMYRQ